MVSTLQPSTERIALKGQKPLSHTTIHGWPAILLGGVFLLIGLPIIAVGTGWMNHPESSIHAPLWVIGICGGIFAGAGAWLRRGRMPIPIVVIGAVAATAGFLVYKTSRQAPDAIEEPVGERVYPLRLKTASLVFSKVRLTLNNFKLTIEV